MSELTDGTIYYVAVSDPPKARSILHIVPPSQFILMRVRDLWKLTMISGDLLYVVSKHHTIGRPPLGFHAIPTLYFKHF